MKLSAFTLFVPQGEEFLVYNTLNRALASIGPKIKSVLEALPGPIPAEAEEALGTLRRVGVVVPEDVNEAEAAQALYDKLRLDKSVMRLAVLTTYFCNFACRYCVEEGVKEPIFMDRAGAERTINWIKERIQQCSVKHLYVLFYGGEPLLNTAPIYSIAEALHDFALEKQIVFECNITTNGSLLTEELVDRLLPMDLGFAQVTLDGDKEAHNQYRPYSDGRGSFDKIIQNLLSVAHKLPISLVANVDEGNIESIPRLLDFLEKTGLKGKIRTFEINPIMPNMAKSESLMFQEINCNRLMDKKMVEALTEMKHRALERGFSPPNRLKHSICGMRQDGGLLVIDPEGKLYTCPAFVGREGFAVGDISRQELNEQHQQFLSYPLEKECFTCTYFPVCGGGCRYGAYVRTGDWRNTICPKDELEEYIPELIKLQRKR